MKAAVHVSVKCLVMSNDLSLVLKWLDPLNVLDVCMELLYKDIFVAGNVLRLEIHSWSLLVKDSNAEVLLWQIDIPTEPLQKNISIPDRLCLFLLAKEILFKLFTVF